MIHLASAFRGNQPADDGCCKSSIVMKNIRRDGKAPSVASVHRFGVEDTHILVWDGIGSKY